MFLLLYQQALEKVWYMLLPLMFDNLRLTQTVDHKSIVIVVTILFGCSDGRPGSYIVTYSAKGLNSKVTIPKCLFVIREVVCASSSIIIHALNSIPCILCALYTDRTNIHTYGVRL